MQPGPYQYQPQMPPPPPKRSKFGMLAAGLSGFLLGGILGCTVGGIGGAATNVAEPAPETTVTVTEQAPASGSTTTAPKKDAPKVGTSFGDGENQAVGSDIQPGSYKTSGGEGCYWSRSKSDSGELEDIIANGNPTGSARVQLRKGEFFTSNGCGTWTKV